MENLKLICLSTFLGMLRTMLRDKPALPFSPRLISHYRVIEAKALSESVKGNLALQVFLLLKKK